MSEKTDAATPEDTRTGKMTGIGRVLVVVYAILALGATGRSISQIAQRFDEAPLAFSLSAFSALVYIIATIGLVLSRRPVWHRIAWVAVIIELVGVLGIGTLSLVVPSLFGTEHTVWSTYGYGYVFIPLVLPFLGLWWLKTHNPSKVAAP